jgi:hypothetical protein
MLKVFIIGLVLVEWLLRKKIGLSVLYLTSRSSKIKADIGKCSDNLIATFSAPPPAREFMRKAT